MGSILIPTVIEKTATHERAYDIWSRLLKDRIIYLGTPIDDTVANLIIAQLLFLKAEDAHKPVSLYINSPGGSITAALAIFDTISFIGLEVHTYGLGLIASAATVLLCAGTKGKRHALPSSRIMIHQPWGGVSGTAIDIELQAKEIIFLKDRLNHIMSDLTGQPIERIMVDSDRDFFMSPQEAAEYGIIDKVLHPEVKK
jgi:ATP-dependent Clp protease protease subunit